MADGVDVSSVWIYRDMGVRILLTQGLLARSKVVPHDNGIMHYFECIV